VEPKYRNGQRVRIKVKDQHGNVKHPKLQEYENETGKIIESEWIARANIVAGGEELGLGDIYLYKIQLDTGIILKKVEEDALVALDD
jgi:hypothetical protein